MVKRTPLKDLFGIPLVKDEFDIESLSKALLEEKISADIFGKIPTEDEYSKYSSTVTITSTIPSDSATYKIKDFTDFMKTAESDSWLDVAAKVKSKLNAEESFTVYDPEPPMSEIHPIILKACKPEYIAAFSEKINGLLANLTLGGPAKLTVKKSDGKFSKRPFIGLEQMRPVSIYNGKRSPIVVLAQVEKTDFEWVEVPLGEMEQHFGSLIMSMLVACANELEMPSEEDKNFEAQAAVYEDFGSWS